VAIAPSEDEVAVGGDDNKTHIFALAAGAGGAYTLTEVATVETRSAVSAVAYSPVGDQLAIGDAGRQVELYARGSWEVRVKGKWVFHTSKITCLAWSPDGAYLASGANDNTLCIFDGANTMSQGAPAKYTLTDHQAAVKALAWSPHERNLLASGGGTADRCIKFWNAASGSLINSVDTGSQVCALQWSPLEKELLSSHGYA
jgi:cell division cycle protein 20 (cofactor of APC complex)